MKLFFYRNHRPVFYWSKLFTSAKFSTDFYKYAMSIYIALNVYSD